MRNKDVNLFSFFIIFIPFLLFLTFIIKSYTGDALLYVNAAQSGWNSFHPHHLLFNFTGSIFYKIFKIFGYSGGALFPMQFMNALFGSLIAYFFYCYSKNILKDEILPLFLSFLTVFSYGFWLNVSNPEVYIATLFFISLSLLFIENTIKSPSFMNILCSAITVSFSMLYHQISIFFFLFTVVYIIMSKLTNKEKIKTVIIYSVISFILTTGIYFMVAHFIQGIRNVSDFNYWLTMYAHQGQWGLWSGVANIKASVGALFHVFFGGGGEEMFLKGLLKRNLSFVNIYLSVLFAIMVGILAVFVYFVLKNPKAISQSLDWRTFPLLSWIIMFGIFYTWWDPGNSEFALFLLIPILLISGILIEKIKIKNKLKLILMGVFLFAFIGFNFFGFILPETSVSQNEQLLISNYLKGQSKEKNLIISLGLSSYLENAYFLYFVPYEVNTFYLSDELGKSGNNLEAVLDKLNRQIDSNLKNGYNIYIDAKLVNPSAANRNDFENRHNHINMESLVPFFKKYDLILIIISNKKPILWKIVKEKHIKEK